MGVIARQSIKSIITSFLGAAIGIISVLFIYPTAPEALGVINVFYSFGYLIYPIISFGLASASIKFFPHFMNSSQTGKGGFLGFLLLSTLGLSIIFLVLFFLFEGKIYSGLSNIKGYDISFFKNNRLLILILAFIIAVTTIISGYISNFGRIVVPTLLTNFGFKIYQPIIILLFTLGYLSLSSIPYTILFYFGIISIFLIFYLSSLNGLDLNLNNLNITSQKYKEVYFFSMVSALTSIGGILVYKIDTIIISGLLGEKMAGLYALPMTMAAVLDIPNMALNSISSPIISKSWNENNLSEINSIYKKSSINLLVIGGLIFLGGYFCFNDLAAISSRPESFDGARIVFLVLAISKLFDMLTSLNSSIIAYSNVYQYNLYFILFLGVINVGLNFMLIPIYGILGSAIAILISMALFNISKLITIYIKFKIHPFSKRMIHWFVITILMFFCLYYLPINYSPLFNIGIKAILITSIYSIAIFYFNISEDVNSVILKNRARLLK